MPARLALLLRSVWPLYLLPCSLIMPGNTRSVGNHTVNDANGAKPSDHWRKFAQQSSQLMSKRFALFDAAIRTWHIKRKILQGKHDVYYAFFSPILV